jgi:hypothetical protein
MNKLNLFLTLILFVGLVCGCNFSREFGGDKQNSHRRGNSSKVLTASKKPHKQANAKPQPDDADESGDQSNPSGTSDESNSAADDKRIGQLAGKWVWGHSGSTTTTASGVYVGSNGSRYTYEFSDDGEVEYSGIMSVMTGSCNMQVFKSGTGQASVSGNTLTIDWEPATLNRDDSCSSSQNYTKTLPAETETFTIDFKKSGGHQQLCLTQKEETCFSRAD